MTFNPFDLAEKKYQQEKKSPFDLAEKSYTESNTLPTLDDENDIQRDIERNQAMFTSRMLEGVLGLPSDLINFAGNIFGFDPGLPGSEKLREFSEKATQGYTSPTNSFEELAGETMQDIAMFALPGAKHYGIARNLGIPIVANLAKEGIKYSGGDEKNQSAAKIGSMVLLDLLSHRKNLGTARQYASSLFEKADSLIPKGLSIKSDNLKNSLLNLEKNLQKGGSQPDTAEALTKIKEILDKIDEKGKIDLKELVAFRPSINKWVDKFKGFEIGGLTDNLRRSAIRNLQSVKQEVIKASEEYGKNFNPEYLKASQSANEAWSAYAQSNKISNFIEKHASSKLKSTGAKALLGGAFAGGAGASATLMGPLGLAGASGLGLGYKIFKTILRSKSPTLRNHYFDIIKGAAAGNSSQVIRNAKLLDKELMDMDITGEINSLEETQ